MKRVLKRSICVSLAFLLCVLGLPAPAARAMEYAQIAPTDQAVTFERIIMQNAEQRALGTDGAGCQWQVSLESSADGDVMLYGIDVAGLYKSTDHGETWVMAVSGIETRGVGMFAIDPHNSDHILALGLGTGVGGMHVSYDQGNSWKKTAELSTYGNRYLWDGLEFDPTTYDAGAHLTTDVYYSTPYQRDTGLRQSPDIVPTVKGTLAEERAGLYRSTDGGRSFEMFIRDPRLADGIVKITASGEVYVGNQYGLFRIDKMNAAILQAYLENDPAEDYSKGITGLDAVGDTVYAQTWDGIYTLNGGVLTRITNESYVGAWPQFLEVSGSNPDHMVYQARKTLDNYYVNDTYVSFDGGEHWQTAANERNSLFFRSNWEGREKLYIIDPADDSNVIAFGSDDLVRSTDGGLHFQQTRGISNMMQGGRFNFNYYEPSLLLFSAQDYTGVISTDGGETYSQLSIPGKGNFYGGFAADRDTIFGFANESWNGGTLTVTHDGGATWTDTGLRSAAVSKAAYYSSLQSPTDPDVFFAAEYYSRDRGYTWKPMAGCISVFTFSYAGDMELYGADEGGNLVVSYDNGESWEQLSTGQWHPSDRLRTQEILDLAYDQVNNCAYAVVQSIIADAADAEKTYTVEEVYKYDVAARTACKLEIPMDRDRGFMRLKSIALDPNSTSVIYVGGAGDYFSSSTGLIRSVNGGQTWSVLTTANNDKYPSNATNQGGYEVSNIRVNPYDGRVWIACGCYGYETFDPPYDPALLNHALPEDHTLRFFHGDRLVHEATLKNNEKLRYEYDEDGLSFVSWYRDPELTQAFPVGSNVFESMNLYAKMEKSVRVAFYDRNRLLWTLDLDRYDKGDETLIPTREGYAFAGWYADRELNAEADLSAVTEDVCVYAGWYRVLENAFDSTQKDISGYIRYSDRRLQGAQEIDNAASAENRCVHVAVEPNSTYLVTFKMDTRFRMGLKNNSMQYWSGGTVAEAYIDPRDTNGAVPANEYVHQTIETKNNSHLLVYYYSANGSRDAMDIKNTFGVYRIETADVKAANEIEGPYCSITDAKREESGLTITAELFDATGIVRRCFCAVYDKAGRMLGSSEPALVSGSPQTFTTACDAASADSARLFLLDEGLAPLTTAQTYMVMS